MPKAIEIKNFSYHYPDGTVALAEINLSVGPGEKLALIGPNGAGKSTLLLGMSGFVKGRVTAHSVIARTTKVLYTDLELRWLTLTKTVPLMLR